MPMPPQQLFLIPCPLGDNALHTLPDYVQSTIHGLEVFIVERAKTARHFIKAAGMPRPIAELTIFELDKHDGQSAQKIFAEAYQTGQSIGVISEAGCPGVADPGAKIVALAHQKGMTIVPLVGPSSILLALMASGMNGQCFAFQGYLPVKKPALATELKRLEGLVRKHRQTQVFIEAPYRNKGLLEVALKTLSADMVLGIAVDLTLPTQWIKSQPVKEWKKGELPALHKRPAVFMVGRG